MGALRTTLTFHSKLFYNQMVAIAGEYKDPKQQELYLDSASRFRLPYWAICMPRNKDDSQATDKVKRDGSWRFGFPKIFKTEKVYVRTPEKPDELKPMDNPFYKLTFPEPEDYTGPVEDRLQINWYNAGFGQFRRWDDTKRRWIYLHASHTIRCQRQSRKGTLTMTNWKNPFSSRHKEL